MALIEKGEQAYQANQFEECLQLFNEALKKARTLEVGLWTDQLDK
jgi:hypothetical protein